MVFDTNDVQHVKNVRRSSIDKHLIDEYFAGTKSTSKVKKLNKKFTVEPRRPGEGLRSKPKPTQRFSPDHTKECTPPAKRKRDGKAKDHSPRKITPKVVQNSQEDLITLKSSEKKDLRHALGRHLDGNDGAYANLVILSNERKVPIRNPFLFGDKMHNLSSNMFRTHVDRNIKTHGMLSSHRRRR